MFLPFLQSHRTFIRYPNHDYFKSRVFMLYTPPESFRDTFPAFHTLAKNLSSIFKNSAKPLCILHRSPTSSSGFLFGLPPSLHSRAARVLHSTSFRYRCNRFHSALPHSVSNSVGLRCFPSSFRRTCSRLFFLYSLKELTLFLSLIISQFTLIKCSEYRLYY